MVNPVEKLSPNIVKEINILLPKLNEEQRSLNLARQNANSNVNQAKESVTAAKPEQTGQVKEENSINAKSEVKKADFSELAAKLSKIVGDDKMSIEFTIDKETNKLIMKLINSETNEVVRQFPSDVSLQIARILASGDKSSGQVANAKI